MILQTSNFNFTTFLIVLIVIIIGIGFSYFEKRKIIKRKLKNAPSITISSFLNGETAKIVGQVEVVGKPLIAPLSGRPCAYYHVVIQEKSGKNSWKTIIEEELSNPFLIRDGSGYAMINTHDIKSCIVFDKDYSSGLLNDASDVLERYLSKYKEHSEGLWGFNRTLRYEEGILEEAEKVAVLGKGEWKKASELKLPPIYNKVLAITATDKDSVHLSDEPSTVKS